MTDSATSWVRRARSCCAAVGVRSKVMHAPVSVAPGITRRSADSTQALGRQPVAAGCRAARSPRLLAGEDPVLRGHLLLDVCLVVAENVEAISIRAGDTHAWPHHSQK